MLAKKHFQTIANIHVMFDMHQYVKMEKQNRGTTQIEGFCLHFGMGLNPLRNKYKK